MSRRLLSSLALTLFVMLPAIGQPVTPAISEKVEQDSPRATQAGTTFTVPAGWTMTTKGSMVILDPPEPDSHLAIVDVTAKDADAAVAAGWAWHAGLHPALDLLPQAPWTGGGAQGLPVRDVAERAPS
jgi:hypothetical protein